MRPASDDSFREGALYIARLAVVFEMTFKKDKSYRSKKAFGVITCPRCDCQVRYGLDEDTRPMYCPDCTVHVAERGTVHESMLRRALPKIHNKTIQEMVAHDKRPD
jgi:hypothetical protein